MHSLARTSRRVFSGALALGLLASIVLVAVPASADTRQAVGAAAYIPGTPDPLWPNHLVFYDQTGGKWADSLSAAAENDAIAAKAFAAQKSAQAVPSSFWGRQVAAVKASGGGSAQVAKVMEQGNLTKYSRTSIMVAEKIVPATTEAAAAAVKLAPRIPAVALGVATKVVGGVGTAIFAYQVGSTMGAGGLKLMGIDANGTVCRQAASMDGLGATMLSALAGQDCTAYEKATAFIADKDIAPGVTSGPICTEAGLCVVLTKFGQFRPQGWSNDAGYVCVSYSGGADVAGGYLRDPVGRQMYAWDAANPVGSMFSLTAQTATKAYAPFYSDKCGGPDAYLVLLGNVTDNPHPIFGTIPRHSFGWLNDAERTSVPFMSGKVAAPLIETSTNPARKFTTTITGSDGLPYVASTPDFHEGDRTYPLPAMPVLPPQVKPTNLRLDESGVSDPLLNSPTSPEYRDLLAKYPECAEGACLLDLRTNGASCFAGATDCAEWFVDLTKSTDYTCTYGTHALDLSECNVYAETFKADAINKGATWADPQTGLPLGAASSLPGSASAADKTVADASQPRNCFPTGWAALNPVNWVMQPVQCALEWAFVPRESVLKDNDIRLRGAAGGGVLGSIAAVGGSLVAFPVVADGCGGVPWRFKVYSLDIKADLLNSCPGEPLHDISVQVKNIVTAILWSIAILAWIRYIATIFGYTGFGSGTPADTTAGGPVDTGGGGVHLFPAYQTDQRAIGSGSGSQGAIGGRQRAIGSGSGQGEIGQ